MSGFTTSLLLSEDYATVKYNAAGEEQWIITYHSPGDIYEEVKDIAVDGSGNVYITGTNEGNNWSIVTTIKYAQGPVSVETNEKLKATGFALAQNFPNPFNNSTLIQYHLHYPADVELSIYNLQGQKVTTLLRDYRSAGSHQITWNATDESSRTVSSGIYLYRLKAGNFTATRKMLLLR